MASMVRLICPNLSCRSILAVPISARGKMVRCRSCGMRVTVPKGGVDKPQPTSEAGPESK